MCSLPWQLFLCACCSGGTAPVSVPHFSWAPPQSASPSLHYFATVSHPISEEIRFSSPAPPTWLFPLSLLILLIFLCRDNARRPAEERLGDEANSCYLFSWSHTHTHKRTCVGQMCHSFHSFVSNPDDLISPLGICNVCALIAHSLPLGSVCICPSHTHTHVRARTAPAVHLWLSLSLSNNLSPSELDTISYIHTSIDAARYIQAHTYSLGFVCANTLSQQIMTELWVTAPVANSRRGVRGGAGGGGVRSTLPIPPTPRPPRSGPRWCLHCLPSSLSPHTTHSFFIASPLSITIVWDPVSLLTAHTLIPH